MDGRRCSIGRGMHWARGNVNEIVALWALVCSRRWKEGLGGAAGRARAFARRHLARDAPECPAPLLMAVPPARVVGWW